MAKGAVKQGAYIDLETELAQAYFDAWDAQFKPLRDKITKAIESRDFDKAHDLADMIDMAPVAKSLKGKTKTFGKAAMLLGARNVNRSVRDTDVYSDPRNDLIDKATAQIGTILARNATDALKMQAHSEIEKAKKFDLDGDVQLVAKSGDRISLSAKAAYKVAFGGKSFSGLAASMYMSRLRSLGFLQEGVSKGLDTYAINAVMDSRTSDICRSMNGRIFSVPQAFSKIEQSLSADDPDAVKSIQPWPKTDKSTVRSMSSKSSAELIDAGLSLPPYHPNCRTVITLVSQAEKIHPQTAAELELTATAAGSVVGAVTGIMIADALFGDTDPGDVITDEVVFEESFQQVDDTYGEL